METRRQEIAHFPLKSTIRKPAAHVQWENANVPRPPRGRREGGVETAVLWRHSLITGASAGYFQGEDHRKQCGPRATWPCVFPKKLEIQISTWFANFYTMAAHLISIHTHTHTSEPGAACSLPACDLCSKSTHSLMPTNIITAAASSSRLFHGEL